MGTNLAFIFVIVKEIDLKLSQDEIFLAKIFG